MSQAVALAKKPHIVVATPGRIVDHLENTKGFHLRAIKVSHLRPTLRSSFFFVAHPLATQYLVMDEADRLLNMEFEEEINKILQCIPKERNTFLFSATMTSKVRYFDYFLFLVALRVINNDTCALWMVI